MENNEEISVVVPVYNRADIVSDTLESIEGQTYRPLHLILVDNNSADDSLKVLQHWKERHETEGFRVTVVSETRPGAAAARNRGLREVTSDKLVFFDSDDFMGPHMIEAGARAMRENPDAVFAHWRYEMLNLDGSRRISHFTQGDRMECHLVHALLNTPSYLVKTGYFRRIGGWSEDMRVWDDFELGVRILLPQPKAVGIDKVLYTVKSVPVSITGTEFSSRAGEWEKALDRIEAEIMASRNREGERWLRIVDYRRIILAAHYAKEGRQDLAGTLRKQTMTRNDCAERGKPRLSFLRRRLLDLAYHYTRKGGRGAWLLLRHFF